MVVRYLDGRVVKGHCNDFYPTKDRFVVTERGTDQEIEVSFADLKAVFFVRSFDTDGALRPRDDIDRYGVGRKLKVRFRDGEEMIGFSSTYGVDRKTFVLFPGDPDCNNRRIVIAVNSTESIEYI